MRNAPTPEAATFPATALPYVQCVCGHQVSARTLRGLQEGFNDHVVRGHPNTVVRAAMELRPIRAEAPSSA